jgi:uncharacterized protein with von Willebrand factor type A (vWA) domain
MGKSYYFNGGSSYTGGSSSYGYGSNYGYGSGKIGYGNVDYGYKSNRSYNGSSYWGTWGADLWGASSWDEDTDEGLCVKAHDNYLTPTASEIKLKDYRLRDTNLVALTKEFARYFFYRMIDEPDYLDPAFEFTDETEYKKELMEKYWDEYVPGYSPLEKAINVVLKLSNQGEKKQQSQLKDTYEDDGGSFDERVWADPILNELLDMNQFSKKHKFDILNLLSLVQDLGNEFKIEKEIEEKIVANSRIVTKKMMRDYSQMAQIDLYQRLMPTFPVKLLTKDLVINTPVERTEHKQKIIMILDFSGSMRQEDKQSWVTALLVDRLRYAIKEEAELFFSYFVCDPEQLNFTHIHDRKTALEFWQTFSHFPNGGDTDIGAMINRIGDEIQQGRLMNLNIDLREDRPEILVLNDGQDSVKTDNFPYKTNGMSLMDYDNEELRTLCLKNNGKYVFISRNEQHIKAYNSNGTHSEISIKSGKSLSQDYMD